jgi:flagellar motility protein MotE (MotC chaperone)
MTNGFFKKTGQTARDLARKTARQVAREPLEILKSAAPTYLREKDSLNIPQAEGVVTPPKAIENIDVNALNTQTKKRLEELEQEIQKIRQERAAKLQKWNEEQQALLDEGKSKSEEKTFIEPQSRKKRGFLGFRKKKQGTKEMGKQVSG